MSKASLLYIPQLYIPQAQLQTPPPLTKKAVFFATRLLDYLLFKTFRLLVIQNVLPAH